MKIVFIGSGNVATHMAMALKNAGSHIIQIFSRTDTHAHLLANKVSAEPISDLNNLNREADLYIFSLNDDILPSFIKMMPNTTGIWAHTAGSVPMNLFKERLNRGGYGVIYPLQTFSKERELDFTKISVFVEGDISENETTLLSLARTISDDVKLLDSESRKYLHLAAVFANNFANHMFTLANEVLSERGVAFDALRPLIAETAAKVLEMEPKKAQTGPAIRLDEKVINNHLELIKDDKIKEIYTILSESINRHSS
ncbi:MAG: DUF2520 domain-containing protein [Bacteroidales bacterium]|nr:DUF2520 domain-containing protein [Bacteroidales bacterium]